jgi:hypothetical protein
MARTSTLLLSASVVLGASALAFGDANACQARSEASSDAADKSGVIDLTTPTKCAEQYAPVGKEGNKRGPASEGVPTPAIPYDVIVRHCFRKTNLQDGSLVLLNWCTNQQVTIPPGGNECLRASIPTAWKTIWFEDTCTGKQVEAPLAQSQEALRLMKRNRLQPDDPAVSANSASAEGS